VVYSADQDTDEIFELYRANLKTGAVTKLNPTLVANGDVGGFDIGPKGESVVYSADQDTDGVRELYRVDLKTGAVTKLNETLVAGGRVTSFEIIGN
jgi:6-phosphogluconolactonase (cycloisomerase 2 family)